MRLSINKWMVGFVFFLVTVVVFNVPGNKLIFLIFLGYSLLHRCPYDQNFYLYGLFAFSLSLLYVMFSLMEGGEWGVIKGSAFSCLFLLSFFVFVFFFQNMLSNQIVRYLQLSSYIFIAYLSFLIALSILYPHALRKIDLLDSNLSVAWYDHFPRVILKTMALIGPFSLIAIYYSSRKFVIGGTFLVFSVLTQEVMAIFLVLCAIILNLFFLKRYFIIIASFIVLFMVLVFYGGDIYLAKSHSILEKLSQVLGFMDVLSKNPILGVGLGNPIVGLGFNVESIYYIEVIPLDYLIKSGIVGFMCFSMLYLFPVYYGWLKYKKSLDFNYLIFALSHLLVVISGLSNPYVLSGSLGFLFSTILFAYAFVFKSRYSGK